MDINKSMNTAVGNTKDMTDNYNTMKVNTSLQTGLQNTVEFAESDWMKRHKYKLASHNTMSYLTPKNWLDRILAFTARCQSKSIYEQIERYGVQLVDLRFKFDKKGNVCFAHGAIEYKSDINFIDDILGYLNTYKDFPARVMFENKGNDVRAEKYFIEWCKRIEEKFPNIKFFGGRNKWTWKEVYKFPTPHASVEDKYSSCNTNEPGKPQTGTYIDDLCPIWYAHAHNKDNRERGTLKDYVMVDFVEIM